MRSRALIVALAGLAVSGAAFGVLVPEARWPWYGALACFLAAVALAARARHGGGALCACGVWLAVVFASRFVVPEFNRADSIAYFVYLRSAVFDGDLDFSDEYEALGSTGHTTATGVPANMQSVGPAVVWSPFYLAAHALVRAQGQVEADGYGKPYRRSILLGSLTVATLGAALLLSTLARQRGWKPALLGGLGVLASPIPYYAFVVPGMAHAVTFGLACALLWTLSRAEEAPSLTTWLVLGAILGLLVMSRWQAVVYLLLVGPFAVAGLLRRTVRPLWVAAALGTGLLAFSPQLVAWNSLYGSLVAMPQGAGFVDWSSPRFLDTLISADHGFFAWTPAMAGILGLLLAVRRTPLLAAGGLLVFLATAWVNGGVRDWAASDAFGARRFDLVVPLVVVGLTALVERAAALVRARPLLVPGVALSFLVAWNVGLIGLFREFRYRAAPLERVAHDQVRRLRLSLQARSGGMLGDWAPALVYKAFVGEYLYENLAGGAIALGNIDERELSGRWSDRRRPAGEPSFRWALPPISCLRLPLEQPFDLHLAVTLRAPKYCQPQTMEVLANGRGVMSAPVGVEWTEIPFVIPSQLLQPGENALCFRFEKAAPGAEGEPVAAAVSTLRLP